MKQVEGKYEVRLFPVVMQLLYGLIQKFNNIDRY